MHRLTPEGPPVAWGGATYGPDGTLYVTSGQGSNFARLGRLQSDGTFVALNPETNWDVEEFAVADDGRFIAYVVNENGISRLRLIDPATRRVRDAHLPNGIISGLSIAPWGQIAFTLASATSPGDAFVLDPSTMAVTQWTHSETGSLDPRINYMCYASAIRFAGRFRAAQCTVAISNFVTFLENTQSYRRDLRRVEYGDERDPAQREKLIEISPMSRVK